MKQSARQVFISLVVISLVLFAAHTALQLLDRAHVLGSLNWFVSRLDPDAERNLPTLYNTLLLAASASLLARLAFTTRKHWQWGSLAGLFSYLTLDEWFGIHERTIVPLRNALGQASGVFYFTWVIPGICAVAVLCVGYRRFILRLPKATRRLLYIAAGVYLLGALGGDMVSGGLNLAYGSMAYSLTAATEELLEWLGLSILIYGLLEDKG
jgi:hypothetical protein